MPVRMIDDIDLAKKIFDSYLEESVVLWLMDEKDPDKKGKAYNVMGSDTKEIMDNILNLLPNPQMVNEDDFKVKHCRLYLKLLTSILSGISR